MEKRDKEEIKKILDSSLEKHLSSVHEEIHDLRTELKGDIRRLDGKIDKLDDRMIAVESKLGGIHNRIDHETFARKDLEARVRKVVPKLSVSQQYR